MDKGLEGEIAIFRAMVPDVLSQVVQYVRIENDGEDVDIIYNFKKNNFDVIRVVEDNAINMGCNAMFISRIYGSAAKLSKAEGERLAKLLCKRDMVKWIEGFHMYYNHNEKISMERYR